MSDISQLEPKLLWKNFEAICQIPHPSKREQKLAQFIVNFAKSHQLDYTQDDTGNIVIRKPATPGMENRKIAVLQSHIDMVPQKEDDSTHNFETDPIDAYIDGEWVTARGTTLGADNGIGVAAALAVLESNDLQHGPIEALFTIDEETGMTGAFGIKSDLLKGDILLNLDTEEDDELFIGCAGMMDTNIKFVYTEDHSNDNHVALTLEITGLPGGHSGINISHGRGNAIKMMAQLLCEIEAKTQFGLSSIEGGTPVHNAIPRRALATITVPADQKTSIETLVEEWVKNLKEVYKMTAPELTIMVNSVDLPKTVIDSDTQHRLIHALRACWHGVVRMDDNIPGFVETSSNLAYVKSANGEVEIFTSQRSNNFFAQENAGKMIQSTFLLAGAKIHVGGNYPGWLPRTDAPIVQLSQDVYKELFGSTPKVSAIHAGLEFGILGRLYPDMEIISFGPKIEHAHSPEEHVNIQSVGKFWSFLSALLKKIPIK